MRKLLLGLALLALSGTGASAQPWAGRSGPAEARFRHEGRSYVIQRSEAEGEIYIRLNAATGLGQALLGDITLGSYRGSAYERWDAAVKAFLAPTGCERKDLMPIHQRDSWRFTYRCPDGVDLAGLIEAQQADLMKGKPLVVKAESEAAAATAE